MALNEITSPLKDGLEPQVVGYLSEFFQKIGAPIKQDAKFSDLKLSTGAFGDFRQGVPSALMASRMTWEGKSGSLSFLTSLELSIILAGFHKSQDAAAIKEKVQSHTLDDELKAAYGEISGQFQVVLGELLVAKKDKGIRLSLTATELLPEDKSRDSLLEDMPYLVASFSVGVGEMDSQPQHWLISLNLAQEIFSVDLGYKAGASAGVGGTASQIMDAAHPTIPISKTVGDAYDLMIDKKVFALPLIDEGRVVRMVSLNNLEIMRSVFFEAPGLEERQARVMCVPLKMVNQGQKLVSAKADDPVSSLAKKMADYRIESIPVLGEGDVFLGLVTAQKVLGLLGG